MTPHNKALGKGAVLALVLHDWAVDGWGWMATAQESLRHGWAGMAGDFGFISWLAILAFIAGAAWFSRRVETPFRFSGGADDLMPDR